MSTIRQIVIELLREHGEMSRAALLRAVAEHRQLEPRKRALRSEVSTELRELEREGVLIDGGPLVWLNSDHPSCR
jgi:hypothetical protein